MPYLLRDAWLFRAGNYPDKGVSVDAARLQQIVDRTNSLPIATAPPVDLEHGPTERVLDFGRLVPGSLRLVEGAPPGGQQGHWAFGQVLVDAAVDAKLASRGLSVLLDTAQDTIRKVAVTATPRVRGAQFSTEGGTVAFEEGSIMADSVGPGAKPAAAEANPAQQAEPTEGLIARTVAAAFAPFAALLGRSEPEAKPADGKDATDSPEIAALKAQLAASEAKFSDLVKTVDGDREAARAERIKATTERYIGLGVAPALAKLLAPFACGSASVSVAFADGEEAKERGFADVARHILDSSVGQVPMARILPTDDKREVGFADRIDARATELRKADPKLTRAQAIKLAAQEEK